MNKSDIIILVLLTSVLIVVFVVSALIFNLSTQMLTLLSVLIGSSITLDITAYYKYVDFKRDNEKIENTIKGVLDSELPKDLKILKNNFSCLDTELSSISKEGVQTSSMGEFKTSFWDMILLNIPVLHESKTLLKDSGHGIENVNQYISKLGDIASNMEKINQYIRMKENYKIINYHIYNNSIVVKDYDLLLINYHIKLFDLLKELRKLQKEFDFNVEELDKYVQKFK
ncbi:MULTISPECIES: hypothetical protein [Methanobacterium]|uniref:5-bromo-4-chloroindolyl phosphate hydrolysis protein n=1 Tax=Methanobacterium veterum TaxID=408577 RepID=A0A9E5A381_9EURY|nr:MULTISPECIES: hypothetical protein [Methanobacterium]MCZ3367076.1 hypothetical protein [Methanobacterium veterum]MCZ3373777.1 hypothetical protein [Methanobacterium veterum]